MIESEICNKILLFVSQEFCIYQTCFINILLLRIHLEKYSSNLGLQNKTNFFAFSAKISII